VKNAPVISSYELALACVDFLWKQDAALRSLGLERLSIKAGQVTVAMTVLPAMVNGLGITHGGAIFAFADSAFSLACNTLVSSRSSSSIGRMTASDFRWTFNRHLLREAHCADVTLTR